MVLSKMNNHEHRTKQTYERYTFLTPYEFLVQSIEYVALTFESEDEILLSDRSNETSSAVLSHGIISLECNSNSLVGV